MLAASVRFTIVCLLVLQAASARAEVRPTVSAGLGFTELAHVEGGVYLTSQVAVEASAAWLGVFGTKVGLGVVYSLARGPGDRPAPHGLLLGARAMTAPRPRLASNGDDLGSYALVFGGYGFASETGLSVRFTGGPVLLWEQAPLAGGGHLVISGPFVHGSVGWIF